MRVKICQIRRDTNGNITHRRFFVPKTAIVRREGTRAPDNMEFTVDIVSDIKENDEIYYIQDIIDTDNLVGMYNFYGNFRDESGYEQDDVRASNIDIPECVDLSGSSSIYERLRLYESVGTSRQKYLGFYKTNINASSKDGIKMEKKFVYDSNTNPPIIDMSGNFEIWLEFLPNYTSNLFTLLDFYNESTNKGLLIQWDVPNNQIKITANNGGTANVATCPLTFDTDLFHLRIGRNNGEFFVYVNQEEKTVTNASYSADLNHTDPYWYMCKSYNESTSSWSDGFSGYFFQLRFYDTILDDDQAYTIWSSKAQQLTMKFGGFIWKLEDGISKRAQCKGWSAKILSKIISPSTMTNAPSFSQVARTGVIYTDGKSYEILKDIIYNIGDNEYAFPTDEPNSDPIQYGFGGVNAYGTLLDFMEFLMVMESSSSKKYFFNVLPRKVIVVDQTVDANLACNEYTSNVIENFKDDTKTVNMLEISANNQPKTDSYSVSKSFTTNTLTTSSIIMGYDSLRTWQTDVVVDSVTYAEINGVQADVYQYNETIPSGSYGIKLSEDKTSFQAQAPLTNGNYTVKLWFTFRFFILNALSSVQVKTDATSVSEIGIYPRRLAVRQLEDGINLGSFATKYLDLFKDVKQRVKVRFNGLINSVTIGQKLPVSYKSKKLYTSYNESTGELIPLRLPVSSVEWRYPEGTTVIELGDNEYNTFDLEKITIDQLRGLDNTTNKSTLI